MSELISVIVPMYNAEKTIARCVESILCQTYSNLEIILVNDGSTDSSIIISQSFEDERITIINQENQGVSQTRNTGIDNSHGNYICFIDSDDYIVKNHIELMYQLIRKDKADLVIVNFYIVTNCKVILNRNIKNYSKCFISDCIYDIYANSMLNQPWNKLYRKEYLNNRFPKDISLGEDLIFNIDYIKQIEKISVSNLASYYYDMQGDGLHKQKLSILEFLNLYQYIYTNIFDNFKFHQCKFDYFVLKHYVRFLYENQYKADRINYRIYSTFCKKNNIKSSFILFYLLNIVYQVFKGVKG